MRLFQLWTIALVMVLITACGGGGETGEGTEAEGGGAATGSIEVSDPWVRPMAAGVMDHGDMEGMEEGEMEGMEEGEMEGMEGMEGMEEGAMDHGDMDHGDMDMGVTSAAYMILANSGDAADTVVSASTDVAETVELHNVEMDDGVMRMRPVESIEVPAGGEVALEPGSYHIMLIGLTQDLNEGDMVNLTLELANAGEIEVEAEVRQSAE